MVFHVEIINNFNALLLGIQVSLLFFVFALTVLSVPGSVCTVTQLAPGRLRTWMRCGEGTRVSRRPCAAQTARWNDRLMGSCCL